MPAAVMARGMLTFAFFGVDAYVSLTFVEVRGQPAWVSGAALTAAALWWTTGAWIQQRLVSSVGPRVLVVAGFTCVAAGILGMLAAIHRLPLGPAIAVWSIAGLGMGLAYASISVTVLGAAAPGQEGAASASLQLTDVLGVVLGTGAGGAFIAIGARAWMDAGLESGARLRRDAGDGGARHRRGAPPAALGAERRPVVAAQQIRLAAGRRSAAWTAPTRRGKHSACLVAALLSVVAGIAGARLLALGYPSGVIGLAVGVLLLRWPISLRQVAPPDAACAHGRAVCGYWR
jgi:hypothetical protein